MSFEDVNGHPAWHHHRNDYSCVSDRMYWHDWTIASVVKTLQALRGIFSSPFGVHLCLCLLLPGLVTAHLCPCTSVCVRTSVRLKPPEGRHFVTKSCSTPILGFKVWDLVRVKMRSCRLYDISQGLGVHECWSLFEVSAHLMLVHDALLRVFMTKCVSFLICYLSPTKPRQHPLLVTFHGHQFPCSYARL